MDGNPLRIPNLSKIPENPCGVFLKFIFENRSPTRGDGPLGDSYGVERQLAGLVAVPPQRGLAHEGERRPLEALLV